MTKCTKLRVGLLSATMFSSVAVTAQASAQEATGTQTDAETSSATTFGDEIIVTGTRRATTVQDTPINITAIGAEDLEKQRIDDVRDLADFTPGLTIADTGPGATGTIVMRGLRASDTDSGSNADTAMGVYLGEVPLYYDFKLLDVERVETLLGPQGTLYGLGTLAGAIRYIPKRPDANEVEGEVHGRFYAKDHSDMLGYQIDGVINLPILTDHIAFRSATGFYYDPGFIDYTLLLQEPGVSLPQPDGPTSVSEAGYAANLTRREDLNFERTFSTRNQLLFQTTKDLQVIFTYAYQRTETEGAQGNSAGVLGTGRYENASRYVEPVTRQAHLASMEVNANIADFVDLVSTTAYTNVQTDSVGDVTDLLLDLDYDYELFPAFSGWNESHTDREQINQEVRLVSRHGGPLNWVLGGFYNEQKLQRDYAEHIPGHPWVDLATNPEEIEYASYTTSKVTEKAIFGEGTFRIIPEWQVTAGARYFGYTSEIAGAATLPLLGQPLSPYDLDVNGGEDEQDGWVWKFNTSFDLTPDLMVYATYSKGYRIGGPNTVAPCQDPLPEGQNICALPDELQYGPDTTKNIEIGMRAQLFDMLRLNFNIYKIDWEGIQVASATVNGATGITVNGGTAESKGFETSFQITPVPELTIQGNYSYNDAKLTQDVPGILTIRETPNDYSNRFVQLDALAGDRLPGSARHSGSLGATYTVPLKNAELLVNWTTTHRGDVVTRLGWDRAYGDKLPAYTLHRAAITYEADIYSFTLFANNIFNTYAVSASNNDRSRIGVNDGVAVRYYGQTVINPRTIGIEARTRF